MASRQSSSASSDESKQNEAESSTTAKRTFTENDIEILAERLGRDKAEVTYLTPDRLSWIIHAKKWMPTTSREEFENQWNLHPSDRHQLRLFGKMFTENRYSQSWGHSYLYSGTTNTARPIQESAMIQALIDRANEATRGLFASSSSSEGRTESEPYNGCLQNWYYPEDTIGLHADDERDLQAHYPIFSLTWGGTRRFVMKPRDKTLERVELYLEDGDLLLMGGNCQKTHRHQLPKPRTTKDPATSDRINWTIRAFRNSASSTADD